MVVISVGRLPHLDFNPRTLVVIGCYRGSDFTGYRTPHVWFG